MILGLMLDFDDFEDDILEYVCFFFFQLSAASQMGFRDSNDTTVNSHGCRKNPP